MAQASFRVSSSPDSFFVNEKVGDLLVHAGTSNQRILVGTSRGVDPVLVVDSNYASVSGNLSALNVSTNQVLSTGITLIESSGVVGDPLLPVAYYGSSSSSSGAGTFPSIVTLVAGAVPQVDGTATIGESNMRFANVWSSNLSVSGGVLSSAATASIGTKDAPFQCAWVGAVRTVAVQHGTEASPLAGGRVTVDLSVASDAIVHLSSEDRTALAISFDPTSFTSEHTSMSGTITLVERHASGRAISLDDRVRLAGAGSLPSIAKTTGAPDGGVGSVAVHQLAYTVVSADLITATLSSAAVLSQMIATEPYTGWYATQTNVEPRDLIPGPSNTVVYAGQRAESYVSGVGYVMLVATLSDGSTVIDGFYRNFIAFHNASDGSLARVYKLMNYVSRLNKGIWIDHWLSPRPAGGVYCAVTYELENVAQNAGMDDMTGTRIVSFSDGQDVDLTHALFALDDAGQVSWLCRGTNANIYNISTSGHDGGPIVSGLTTGPESPVFKNAATTDTYTVAFDNARRTNVYTVKLSADGAFQWHARLLTAVSNGYTFRTSAHATTGDIVTYCPCYGYDAGDIVVDGANQRHALPQQDPDYWYNCGRVCRFDKDGTFKWAAVQANPRAEVSCVCVAVTPNGNAVVMGLTGMSGTAYSVYVHNADGSRANALTLTSDSVTGYVQTMHLVCYSPDGDALWSTRVENGDTELYDDKSNDSLTATSDGGVLLGSTSWGALKLYSAGGMLAAELPTSIVRVGMVYAKFSSSGDVVWHASVIPDADGSVKYAVVAETSDLGFAVGGRTTVAATFTDAQGSTRTVTDTFIIKLTRNGTFAS